MPGKRRIEVRRGITRAVLLVGPWAIKVPSLRANGLSARGVMWSMSRGVSANLSEISWTGSPGTCPVRWSLAGLVNVYPRLEHVDPALEVDYDAIGFLGPADRKPENLGWLDGQVVYVDFDMSWNDCPHSRNLDRLAPDDDDLVDPVHDPVVDVPGLFGPDGGMETLR